jgi:predicted phage terminase large subunit-like protein
VTAPIPRLELPAKCLPLVQDPRRYNVLKGGRGSAKSRSVAGILVVNGLAGDRRLLCTREIQKSMKDSVHRLLADTIERLGLGAYYKVLETEIRGPGNTLFLFSGLQGHTVESIKSYEDLTDVWVEEATSVVDRSWEILIPTLRRPGSRFWITFNPDLEDDPVYQRFVVNPPEPERCHIITLNYSDNPWFNDTELAAESAELKAKNPDVWLHVYGGQLRSIQGLIFKRDWFKWYDPDTETPENLRLYMASDYAVTPDGGDYTEHGIGGLDPAGNLYLTDWWAGQTDPATWIDAALDLGKRHKPVGWFEEKGVILRAVDGSINKRMQERNCYLNRHGLASAGSKADRALGFAARAAAGTVYLPKKRPWALRLLNQLLSFHGEGEQIDDGVDVCSLLARGLDLMFNADEPAKPKAPPPEFGTQAWFDARDRQHRMNENQKSRYYT